MSKGALLANEVGLGKTSEAGLVLCQDWAERKRRLIEEEFQRLMLDVEDVRWQNQSTGLL